MIDPTGKGMAFALESEIGDVRGLIEVVEGERSRALERSRLLGRHGCPRASDRALGAFEAPGKVRDLLNGQFYAASCELGDVRARIDYKPMRGGPP